MPPAALGEAKISLFKTVFYANPSPPCRPQGGELAHERNLRGLISADYQRKDWCGVEFRAIREIILKRENDRVLFVRTDDGEVDGVFKSDGYLDARKFTPEQIAGFICERLEILAQR